MLEAEQDGRLVGELIESGHRFAEFHLTVCHSRVPTPVSRRMIVCKRKGKPVTHVHRKKSLRRRSGSLLRGGLQTIHPRQSQRHASPTQKVATIQFSFRVHYFSLNNDDVTMVLMSVRILCPSF